MDISSILDDRSLFDEVQFARRVQALDDLEFHALGGAGDRRVDEVVRALEAVDAALFARLREEIRRGASLRTLIETYAGDALDSFVAALFLRGEMPVPQREREPEMVFYQPTPAHIVMQMIERGIGAGDVFYDLGSGLGQVAMLVHLLTGATVKGIEYEPAYVAYARRCAADLNLAGVSFINEDARNVNYDDATVAFLYTPFTGRMLRDALERLRGRPVRIFTYGPCTAEVARVEWLRAVHEADANTLGAFEPA